MKARFVPLPLAAVLCAAASAQVEWRQIPHLTGRQDHAVAFDEARGVLVLFGGLQGTAVLGDTWEWDGAAWTPRTSATSPAARQNHAMVYDASRQRVVLFGGRVGYTYLDDTWEWDGTSWLRALPAASPPPRAEHGMAFDRSRGRTVVFGGHVQGIKAADTWEWDGARWTQVTGTVSPPARAEHVLAWHAGTGRVLLYGGQSDQGGLQLEDTWEYDGTGWSQRSPQNVPPARSRFVLASGPGGSVVLFGGFQLVPHGALLLDDTWIWDGGEWSFTAPVPRPSPRERVTAAYDPARGRTLLFGASSPFGTPAPEVWAFDGAAWAQLSAGTRPDQALDHRLAWDANRGRVLHVGALRGLLVDTWEWTGRTWDRLSPATPPPWRLRPGIASDTGRQRVVMFGGWANVLLDDTWEFDGSDWVERRPSTLPPPLDDHAMAYDPARARTVMFGGGTHGPLYYLNQTWEWDGNDWTLRQPANAPSPRRGAALAFDEQRGVVLLFGGRDASLTPLDDTWTWDGNDWTQRNPATNPLPRMAATMSYDRARRRVVMVGGSLVPQTDTWEWDGVDWRQRAPSPDLTFRTGQAMAYDRARERVVLSGGYDPGTRSLLHETWEYSATQPSGWAPFGTGCTGSVGTPLLAAESRPWLGEVLSLEMQNLPPTGGAILYFGFSRTTWGSFQLPLHLAFVGATGCLLHVSPDVSVPLSNLGGRARLDFTMPASPSLAGLEFYNQGLVLDPGANRLGVVYSNAGVGTIGVL